MANLSNMLVGLSSWKHYMGVFGAPATLASEDRAALVKRIADYDSPPSMDDMRQFYGQSAFSGLMHYNMHYRTTGQYKGSMQWAFYNGTSLPQEGLVFIPSHFSHENTQRAPGQEVGNLTGSIHGFWYPCLFMYLGDFDIYGFLCPKLAIVGAKI